MSKEFYGYFDSVPGDIREYNEADLSRGFRVMAGTGVATLDHDNLKVFPADSGLRTRIHYGGAMVQGFAYELYDDGGTPRTKDHSLATSYPRIDRVVARLDLASGARHITLAVIQGAEAQSPTPPTLTRAGTVYEISLAQCRVNPGATTFQAGDLTDERADPAVCGNLRAAFVEAARAEATAAEAQEAAREARERVGALDAAKAPVDHGHALTGTGITGVLPATKGGTGLTTLQAARNAMGLGDTAGPVPVTSGGTGANAVGAAQANLGFRRGWVAAGATASATVTVPVAFSTVFAAPPSAVLLTLEETDLATTIYAFVEIDTITAAGFNATVRNTSTQGRPVRVHYVAIA